jgi:two-component system, cell cycle sensor histidine kinase and response regulator CckA
VLLVEPDGTFAGANPAAQRLLGQPVAVLLERGVGSLAPDLATRWPHLMRRVASEREVSVDVEVDAASGAGRQTLRLQLSLVAGPGRHLIQAFVCDVSERSPAPSPPPPQAQQDEQLAAKQRLESLGLVAGGIAHDFNNLLVGVLAEASAAREDRTLSDGAREALRRIEAAARRMAQLTRQLLAYAGRGQFVTVPIAPDELLAELREQLVRLVRPELELDVAPGAQATVIEADPSLLRQVVLNLVANASDAGTRRVAVGTRTVLRDGTPWWQLEISDDGAGMDPATLGRIFEPFFSTKPDRHGLGLSAVHGIVRRLGGVIEVDSRRGQGSRFRVQLPTVKNVEPVARANRPASDSDVTPKLFGLRVLVADDEPSVRATVRRLLERRGATVVVAADGSEAEARLHDEQFGLVISDVAMPGLSGYDVLAVARSIDAKMPVLLMSGYTERARGEGSEEEADAFLEKPFTARALDDAIDEVLKGR